MKHNVATYRAAGLEARWTKTRAGAPVIVVRNPTAKLLHQRQEWWVVTKSMFSAMEKDGIVEGFDCATLIGDVFSIAA